jgi:hypothetical protein
LALLKKLNQELREEPDQQRRSSAYHFPPRGSGRLLVPARRLVCVRALAAIKISREGRAYAGCTEGAFDLRESILGKRLGEGTERRTSGKLYRPACQLGHRP